MSDAKVVHYEDIGYSVVYVVDEYHIGVEVSEICAPEMVSQGRMFRDEDDQFIYDLDKAERVIKGSIKWDGCSNWNMMPDDTLLHFCGKEGAIGLGTLLGRLYDIAKAEIPRADF